jgi:hypothetical protein
MPDQEGVSQDLMIAAMLVRTPGLENNYYEDVVLSVEEAWWCISTPSLALT